MVREFAYVCLVSFPYCLVLVSRYVLLKFNIDLLFSGLNLCVSILCVSSGVFYSYMFLRLLFY